MSISQDDNGALQFEGSSDGDGYSVDDIMSPEDIAAMLDEAPPPGDSGGGSDIMSPEDIAQMLDEAVPSDDSGADIGSPEDISSVAGSGADDGDSELDMLFDNLESSSGNTDSFPVISSKEVMLTPDEVDILGEVGNISMGAVATTMYSLLDRRVSITTPRVSVFDAKDVLSTYQIPFVVATIEYIQGITGTNLLVLRVDDAALITDLLMGGDGTVEQPVELNEMHLSAMSEIMNQMMGASSTSLSKLLHEPINISPPTSSQVDIGFDVSSLLGDAELVTKISFDMEIEGLLNSELIQLMPYEGSREFAERFVDIGMGVPATQRETRSPAPPPPAPPPPAHEPPPPAPPPPAPPPPAYEPPPQAPPPPAQYEPAPAHHGYQQPPPQYPPAPYPQYQPPVQYQPPQQFVDVHPAQFQTFDAPGAQGERKGIDLVYNIPLQVTVELGKTKKEISEILEFGMGTIVVLDKMAGDPVEIVVNGKLIARGEVVVIDESYGVRITDIISS